MLNEELDDELLEKEIVYKGNNKIIIEAIKSCSELINSLSSLISLDIKNFTEIENNFVKSQISLRLLEKIFIKADMNLEKALNFQIFKIKNEIYKNKLKVSCTHCNGVGVWFNNKCSNCNGVGYFEKERETQIVINYYDNLFDRPKTEE